MKFSLERSTHINAPLETVKPLIANFAHWSTWSPWNIIEPECPVTVEGAVGQPGHKMSWNGDVIGSGTNTITKVESEAIHYNVAFLKPWKSKATSAFVFTPADSGTTVTWQFESSMPLFLFFMIPMMRAWIGMDYDRGLRMLKELAEKGEIRANTYSKGVVELEGFSYVGIQKTVPLKDIAQHTQEDFNAIIKDIVVERNLSPKNWVSLYPKMDMKNGTVTYIAAVSDESLQGVDLGAEYVRGTVAPSRALEIMHEGSYDFIGNAWSMGMMHIRAKKMKQNGVPFEQYWNSPLETAPEDLRTSIFFPIK